VGIARNAWRCQSSACLQALFLGRIGALTAIIRSGALTQFRSSKKFSVLRESPAEGGKIRTDKDHVTLGNRSKDTAAGRTQS